MKVDLMVIENSNNGSGTQVKPLDFLFWFVIPWCVCILALSITKSSLWIDEAWIAWVVDHRSFGGVVAALTGSAVPSPTDRQYPLYDVWEWAWARLFGSSEYALRSANVPFAAIYVVAIAVTSRYAFKRRFTWIPFAFNPFVWYYMNEARPYVMLAAFGTSAVGLTLIYIYGKPRARAIAVRLILPAILLTWLTHILAVMLLPGLLLLVLTARRDRHLFRWSEWRRPILFWAPAFIAVMVFYGMTFSGNNVRTEISKNVRESTPINFIMEDVYEQLGFAGLGPSRNALRSGDKVDVIPYLPWLICGSSVYVAVFYQALQRGVSRTMVLIVASWVSCLLFAFVAADIMSARFLARHMAATLALPTFAVMSLVRSRVAVIALIAVFIASDLRLSLLHEYAKDDYRGAVADIIARCKARPGAIDWAADDLSANYYGLSLINGRNERETHVPWPVRAAGTKVTNLRPVDALKLLKEQLSSGKPVYLAMSKRDLFDKLGGWRTALDEAAGKEVLDLSAFRLFVFEPKKLHSHLKERLKS